MRILAQDAFKFFSWYLAWIEGNYLEIGVFEGVMLRELSRRFPYKMFYGIDPFIEDGYTSGHNGGVLKGEITHEQKRIAHENCDGIPNIKLFEQTSRSFFIEHHDGDLLKMKVTSVLIDGDHSYEEARNDMRNAMRFNPQVIFIDDLGLPEVKRAADECDLGEITFFT